MLVTVQYSLARETHGERRDVEGDDVKTSSSERVRLL